MQKTSLTILFTLLLGSVCVAAEDRLSGFPSTVLSGAVAETTQHEVEKRPVSSIKAGGTAIVLEKTPLAELQQKFGGSIHHAGDAGESVYWLCYMAGGGGQPFRLWFLADGEMGGPDHQVTMVAAESGAGTGQECASVSTIEGLDFSVPGIGATTSDVRARLGPVEAEDGLVSYQHEGPASNPDFTTFQVLTYRFKDGKVEAIAVSQVTSN